MKLSFCASLALTKNAIASIVWVVPNNLEISSPCFCLRPVQSSLAGHILCPLCPSPKHRICIELTRPSRMPNVECLVQR